MFFAVPPELALLINFVHLILGEGGHEQRAAESDSD